MCGCMCAQTDQTVVVHIDVQQDMQYVDVYRVRTLEKECMQCYIVWLSLKIEDQGFHILCTTSLRSKGMETLFIRI